MAEKSFRCSGGPFHQEQFFVEADQDMHRFKTSDGQVAVYEVERTHYGEMAFNPGGQKYTSPAGKITGDTLHFRGYEAPQF